LTAIPSTLDALRVPTKSLKPYARNPRRGDLGRLTESLERHGQYRPIVVNVRTQEVLAGNHTLAAAKELGWDEIAATFVDVDEDQAARIVLVDNRANDVAGCDDTVLADLLQELPDLDGTGYDDGALQELLASLQAPAPPAPPDGFADPEAGMTTDYCCPQCGYEWSGQAKPSE
jgi:ParB-like chromosome segregation protein Spo0J